MKTIIITFSLFLLLSCQSQKQIIRKASDFPELNVSLDGTERKYRIATTVYEGDEIGRIKSVSG
ncbi:unnamed protein product, partial [marine sediment metagenome]